MLSELGAWASKGFKRLGPVNFTFYGPLTKCCDQAKKTGTRYPEGQPCQSFWYTRYSTTAKLFFVTLLFHGFLWRHQRGFPSHFYQLNCTRTRGGFHWRKKKDFLTNFLIKFVSFGFSIFDHFLCAKKAYRAASAFPPIAFIFVYKEKINSK